MGFDDLIMSSYEPDNKPNNNRSNSGNENGGSSIGAVIFIVVCILIGLAIWGAYRWKTSTHGAAKYYEVDNGYCVWKIQADKNGHFEIPSEHKGKPVVAVAETTRKRDKIISVSIPDTVKTICVDAFSGFSNLESINISDSVETIGENAFEDCDKLAEINIPTSVTKICAGAFEDCDGLVEITIPASVTEIKKMLLKVVIL